MKIVIALLMLFSTVASAADWQYVASNGNDRIGNNISYDKASVVSNGATRKVWLKFEGIHNAKGSGSTQLWLIRCHDRQYQILTLINNGADLTEGLSHNFNDIQPDSWMEDLLPQVCAH